MSPRSRVFFSRNCQPHTRGLQNSGSLARLSVKTPLKRVLFLTLSCAVLTGCVAGKYTPAEKEMAETMSGEKYQPATREFRDNVETQDLLAQAAFWSREHSLNPGDLEAAIKLASAVRRMGNPGQAIEITQQTRALYPRDPYLAAEYAAALIASERGVDAIDTLDTALRTTPGYARLWSLKGAALDQMEQYELARKHYAKALQITPYDPSILANIGLSYALSGDAATGESWLKRAVAIPGAGPSVRQNLAIVLQLQGKDKEADRFLPRQNSAELRLPPAPPNMQYPQSVRPTPPSQGYGQSYGQGYGQGNRQTNTLSNNRGNNLSNNQGYRASQTYGQKSEPQNYQPQQAPANNRASRVYGQMNGAAAAPTLRSAPTAPTPYTNSANTPFAQPTYTQSQSQYSQYSSASEAARAAARNIENRKMTGRYTEPVTGPTAEQKSILDRLSDNVGPRPSYPQKHSQGYSQNYPQSPAAAQYPQQNVQAGYQATPYNTPPAMPNGQQSNTYPAQAYGQQAPTAYQNPQSMPSRRGAARRR